MMMIRKSHNRGHSQLDWLNSFHTFSFADYYDPDFMGFSSLRVINEDTIQPGQGFNQHAHQNMEIISYVIEGSLKHQDSMGTGSVIKPGEIQRMTAGSGIEHSEFNHSKTGLLHFLQIWIIPEQKNLKPSYEQKIISKENNKFILLGSNNGGNNAIMIHQDVKLWVAYLTNNHSIQYEFEKTRQGWLQLIKGKINLNQQFLSAGDGVAITDETKIEMTCTEHAELLLFDLARKIS